MNDLPINHAPVGKSRPPQSEFEVSSDSSSSSEETENNEDHQMVEHFKQKYERLNTFGP